MSPELVHNLTQATYLLASGLFIFSLRWLSRPDTARRGVLAGVLGMTLAVLGTLVGGVAAAWATKVLGTMLFEVDTKDPMTFTAGAAVLLLVAVGASLIPARRAARVEPVRALNTAG